MGFPLDGVWKEAASPGSESSVGLELPAEPAGGLISRPADEQRPRRRRLGVAGSVVVHVVAAFLFGLLVALFPPPQSETQSSAPREIVTITHRSRQPVALRRPPAATPTVPRAAAARPAPPVARATAPPAPPAPLAPRAPARPRPAVAPHVAKAALPHIVRHPVAPAPVAAAPQAAPAASAGSRARATLSKTRIESIENDLAQSIAAQRNGVAPLPAGTPVAVPDVKRYGPAIAAFDVGDERTHHGLCDPIKAWNADGFDYYYVACNVRFSDGTMQRESVPWPVRFEPNDDPFSGTAGRDLPLAMPLPGWHADSGTYISKELREYAHDHGVDI